jgi:hypothetical protein
MQSGATVRETDYVKTIIGVVRPLVEKGFTRIGIAAFATISIRNRLKTAASFAEESIYDP